MRVRPALATLLVPALFLLGCGTSAGSDSSDTTGGGGKATTTEGSDDPTTTTAPEVPDDPDQALAAAADASLAATTFTVDADAELQITGQEVSYQASGSVDYDTPLADVSIKVSQPTGDGDIAIRADGEHVWVKPNTEGITVPDGKAWVEGDISRLSESDTLEPIGLIGVLVALRAAKDSDAEAGEEIDGVATTKYETTISYADAVEKAGKDRKGFQSALSLTSPTDPKLDVTAWVGDDGIVRRFELEIEGSSGLGGSYDLELTDVNQEIEAPDAPPADDTLTGSKADTLLDQLIS